MFVSPSMHAHSIDALEQQMRHNPPKEMLQTMESIKSLLLSIRQLPATIQVEIGGKTFSAQVHHQFRPALERNAAILELSQLGVDAPQLEQLYEATDGCVLFQCGVDGYFLPPVRFFPLNAIAAQTAYMQASADDEEDANGERPQHSGGMVFADAEGTGNSFVLMKRGELQGKVVYTDHDPDADAFAISPQDLLQQLALPPHQGLCKLWGADKVRFTES
ncbi:SMI1/KNR4 family protein [Duganella sp. Root1480D1]|uniref:SMI1/KNR4 family protein n=1 Tax=Duganella sp. Root1480D1 TaxID=1736471 RepID=UPI00070E9ADB|nr:SMI1/KNR4 family protein [Duganella sp. Root1480D1]KQZ45145.1 hypothetical protein ASD58_02570 [Duganella sp. Root1480D1]